MSLTDEQVIDRLRMALDEVATAAIPETTPITPTSAPTPASRPRGAPP